MAKIKIKINGDEVEIKYGKCNRSDYRNALRAIVDMVSMKFEMTSVDLLEFELSMARLQEEYEEDMLYGEGE